MSNLENFNLLVDKAMRQGRYSQMRPVIEKELLHYDILFCLEKEGLLDKLTFQGGTSLRLCYGAPRFSEDLDFAGGKEFSSKSVQGIKACIESYIGNRYGLDIDVKEPKELKLLPEYMDIKVDKWQVRIITSPEQKDLPKQKIKLEIANVPSYDRVPQALIKNYDFLPDGYEDLLIMTESLDEVMSDKIVSLVSCQKYIRNRDIWDLQWLNKQNANFNIDYIKAKIGDYKVDDYAKKLKSMVERLDDIVRSKPFLDEMSRFIPSDVFERTIQKEKFLMFLSNEIKSMLQQVFKSL